MPPSYGVYISQLNQFVNVSSHSAGFNAPNKIMTELLHWGYRFHKPRKVFLTYIVDTINWFLNTIPD